MKAYFKPMLLLLVIFAISFTSGNNIFNAEAGNYDDDMKAVWISTVYNADFPQTKDNADAQKQEFIDKLEKLKALGINTVVVQIRPKGDALYKSGINPWSEVLTGVEGKDPGYDPLQFMIEEAHKRNMSFHAWMNPYRVTTGGTDVNELSANNPARLHTDWLIQCNNALYYNPSLDEVQKYIAESVKEVVKNYDIDGIHFDDYFYPSGYALPDGEGKDGAIANQRREDINKMVALVSKTIKETKSNVKFGISPMGIWKNEPTGKWGSVVNGNEAYYSVCADARTWIKNGYIDYIVPQIYWEAGNKAADYKTLVKWWADEVQGTNVKLYIGEGLYKDVIAKEIKDHLEFCKDIKNVSGNFYFSSRDLINNRQSSADSIKAFYASNSNGNESIEKPKVYIKTSPTKSNITVNSNLISIGAYNINGYNYFKLRDIAAALANTGSKYSVGWNEATETIDILTDSDYEMAGNELQMPSDANKNALRSSVKLRIDGNDFEAEVYNIDGNNYFKLRDLGEQINFGVTFNEENNCVEILTPSAD